MKIALAFLAAVLLPTSVMGLWYLYGQFAVFPADDPYIWVRTRGFLVICIAVSAAHVLVLGVPAYVLLRWRNAVRWWSVVASGFILGATPVALWSWPLRYSELRSSASFDGVQTMIDGVPTLAGWAQYGQAVLFLGAFGALGGLAFWLTLRAVSPQRRPASISG